MAKRKKSAKTVAKVAKFVKVVKERKARKNPAGVMDRAQVAFLDAAAPVGVGVAAFAGTALLQRIVRNETAKRWPKLAPHLANVSGASAVFLLWWLAKRNDFLGKRKTSVLVGAGVALAVSLLRTYLPSLAWVFDVPGLPGAKASPKVLPADQLADDVMPNADYIEEFVEQAGPPPAAPAEDVQGDLPSPEEYADMQTGVFAVN